LLQNKNPAPTKVPLKHTPLVDSHRAARHLASGASVYGQWWAIIPRWFLLGKWSEANKLRGDMKVVELFVELFQRACWGAGHGEEVVVPGNKLDHMTPFSTSTLWYREFDNIETTASIYFLILCFRK
jgi:hypothetical protein